MEPENEKHYFIANECGFVIEKDDRRIFFRNRSLMPYYHYSWFGGVITGIFFLFFLLMLYMKFSGEGDDKTPLFILISFSLFFSTLIPTIFFIRKYIRIKRIKIGTARIEYVANLSRGTFEDGKGNVLCSLSDMKIQIKSAWDTYLAAGDGDYYEKIIFRWGPLGSARVFKSDRDWLIKEVVEQLQYEFFRTETSQGVSDL